MFRTNHIEKPINLDRGMADASIKWGLEGLGEARLEMLELGLLRSMCEARGIAISAGAHRKTCVEKLLAWKGFSSISPSVSGEAEPLGDEERSLHSPSLSSSVSCSPSPSPSIF